MLRGDPRRLHPGAAVPLRDQPHLPLLLQVPHVLWDRDDERLAAHTPLLAAARQREEFRVSIQYRSIDSITNARPLAPSSARCVPRYSRGPHERLFFPFVFPPWQFATVTATGIIDRQLAGFAQSGWRCSMVVAVVLFVVVPASESRDGVGRIGGVTAEAEADRTGLGCTPLTKLLQKTSRFP